MSLQKSSLKEDVQQVLSTAPAPVREFLTGPARNRAISAIANKHHLRLDQAGVFEQQLILMLLGIIPPPQFVQGLSEAAVSEETVESIVDDVNELIFKPIQDQMRKGSPNNAPSARPPAAGVPSYKPPAPPTPPKPQMQPPPRPPAPQTPQPSAPHTPAPPPANLPGAMGDERLLSDHEVSHINVPSAPAPERRVMPQPAPAMMPQTPRPIAPMPPLPKPLPSAPPPASQQPAPQMQPPAPPAPKPPSDYGADPYREPIDLS